jgi:type I restriction enzyme S subunit
MTVEKLWDLPSSWSWSSLSDLGDIVGGGTPSTKEPKYWGGEINWISPADLTGYDAKTIAHGAKSLSKVGLNNSSAIVMPPGSVHFSSRAPIGYVAISAVPMATNQGFKSLVPKSDVFSEYVYYYLKSAKNLATEHASGTTFLEISGKAFGALSIPVAPHREQRRIVAKIEELFSELDKGVEALTTAREQLKAYRMSILKSAFDGQLTTDWRRVNPSMLISADQTRSRLEQASDACYRLRLKDWNAMDRATRPPKPRPPEPVEAVVGQNAEPFHLPKGWNWVPISWLLSTTKKSMATGPFGTMLKKQEHKTSGVPVLGIENIGKAAFVPGNKIFVSEGKSEELLAFAVEAGDVIISRSGTVGEICEVPAGLGPALISTNLIRVSLNADVIIPAFFVYMFQGGGSVRTQVKNQCKGSSRDFLNQSILAAIKYPLCSLDEQREILKLLNMQMSYVEALTESINTELSRVQSLRQSILKQAFSGQLVEKDPADEPASVLLERIRAERKKADAKKTGRKKKRIKNEEEDAA